MTGKRGAAAARRRVEREPGRILLRRYREVDIYFDGMTHFVARLEGATRDLFEDTFEALQKKIDTYFTKVVKKRTLALPAVGFTKDHEVRFVEGVVTGINLHTARITGLSFDGRHGRQESIDFYPDLDWIRSLIARRQDLQEGINAIDDRLAPYVIDDQRGYRIDDYGDALDALEAEYATKRELADNDR